MTTPVFTTKKQSDGVKMDMTTPVLTTKVVWFFFKDFVKCLNYSPYSLFFILFFHMAFQQSSFNIFFILFIHFTNNGSEIIAPNLLFTFE